MNLSRLEILKLLAASICLIAATTVGVKAMLTGASIGYKPFLSGLIFGGILLLNILQNYKKEVTK
jgi:hypothetical protein